MLFNSQKTNTIILVVFFAFWLYTEITEYVERVDTFGQIHAFMNRGDRFTSQDGEELRKRLEALEERVEE